MDHRKILVVDYDQKAAHEVGSFLEKSGYNVLYAFAEDTALQATRHEKPDLVVLEWVLPGRDGLDILRAIRGDVEQARLPVMILSMYASESDKLRGLEAGADDYIPKPFSPPELLARVQAVLRRCYGQSLPLRAEAAGEEPQDKPVPVHEPDTCGPMIQIEAVTKVYQMGDVQVHALRGVALEVCQGEYLAIMGASGSGKSTLMNVIGLLDRPTSGSYRIDGTEVSRLSRGQLADLRNRQIGFVFQQFNLLPRISARRQVELPLFYAGVSGRQGREMADQALAMVGLGERAHHRPEELSGGQQQRVAIARALVNRPNILLADEPTGALDTRTGAEVLDLIDKLHAQGLTVVMVTHDPNVARRAQRVITLSDGLIISDEQNGRKAAKWIVDYAMETGHETH